MKTRFALEKDRVTPRLAAVLAVVIFIILIWGVSLVRGKLLRNASLLGNDLAQSYAGQVEARFDQYRSLTASYADSIDDALERHASREEIQSLLARHAESAHDEIGHAAYSIYAAIDGGIVGAVPWEGDDTYHYESTEWYQLGLTSSDVAFTNVYTDVITDQLVVTLVTKLEGEGNVLAVDILIDRLPSFIASDALPEGSSHYLFDSNDVLLFKQGPLDLDAENSTTYLTSLVDGVRNGDFSASDAKITDTHGVGRGVYYFVMDNGWVSIITIPLDNLLQDGWDILFVVLGATCITTLILLFTSLLRDRRNRAKNREMAKTLTILGERYYAIYQLNLVNGSYAILKDSPDMLASFPRKGRYKQLLAYMKSLVEESARQEFEKSFSLDNIKKLIKKGVKDFGGDFERRYPDGYHWVNVHYLYNSELSEDEVLFFFRVVDDEKRAELQHLELLENALEGAHRTEERKNEFFSKASHDMRTPLNAIIGLSHLLEKRSDDPHEVLDTAQKIQYSGKQLLTLVNDILDLSHMSATSDIAMDSKPFDLARCLTESIDLVRHSISEEHKILKTTGLDRPVPVYGDELMVTRVFSNLISNAVKYTSAGDEIAVDLRTIIEKDAAARYQITVSDTGTGMSEEFLEHLFEPFTREVRFAPTKVIGTGLGMPIVKSLVQRMSGEITVSSTLGEGTKFVVILPLHPTTEAAINAEKPSEDSEAVPLEGLTILVAEDNDINMEIVLELLSQLGAHTVAVSNGQEALHTFSASAPNTIDVILMDMHMPVMDGCAASEKIRALGRSDANEVTIIAVTANVFTEDIARTAQAGMDGHLAKPIDPNTLGPSIVSIMERKRLR